MSVATLARLDIGLIVHCDPACHEAFPGTADEISKRNLNVPELPVKGSDEISQLARSFNRMYVSLVKAIQMLESQ